MRFPTETVTAVGRHNTMEEINLVHWLSILFM